MVKGNTSYYDKGQLVTSHAKIILNYVQSYFFLDLWTLLSLYNKIYGYDCSLLFVIRAFYDNVILEKLRMKIVLKDKLRGIFDLCILLLKVVYLCHFFACAFYINGRN